MLFVHPLHEQRLKLFLSVDTLADEQSVHRINGRFERFISRRKTQRFLKRHRIPQNDSSDCKH